MNVNFKFTHFRQLKKKLWNVQEKSNIHNKIVCKKINRFYSNKNYSVEKTTIRLKIIKILILNLNLI